MAVGRQEKRAKTVTSCISPASRTIGKHSNRDGLHVHWKEPPVDTIYQYTPLEAVPRVHWREPVVEKVHRYPSGSIHPGRVPAPKPPAIPLKGILKNEEDDFALPPPSYPEEYASNFGDSSQLDTDKLSGYPPLIPLPNSPKAKINRNYKREENFSIDQLSEMIQEPIAAHESSDLKWDAINAPNTFHIQPRAEIVPDAPATLDSSSGLVPRDPVYPQGPEPTAVASQLLLLPILAMWLRALWPAVGNTGSTGRHHRRSLGEGGQRQHARSWTC